MRPEDWRNKGKFITVFGRKIFVIDTGDNKETLAILHGYPTSSYDYYKVFTRTV